MRSLLLALATLAGCTMFSEVDPPEGPATYDEYVEIRADLIAQLDGVIGQASAATPDACRVVAVGEKACGGPLEFRVYSTATADEDVVEALATEITRLDALANVRFGLASDCALATPPTPALVDGRCQAVSDEPDEGGGG